jgi:hypothetical protein
MNMTLIADADIKIKSVAWSEEFGVGLNVDTPSDENEEKVHVILWSDIEIFKDERGYYMDSEGALRGVLVISDPDIELTSGIINEMLDIEISNPRRQEGEITENGGEVRDKVQALMDEVYNEWQKEENKGKGKWDVLEDFSEAHKVAVTFGNFNYQVENGGIEQWIYNGYFHDDSEKFTEYLEIGAESDKRCRAILDRVYTLDQYAQETGSDRDGNYYNEDGDRGFIGEMINGDGFDSWYYERCGKDDWWEIVSGIIDKIEARGLAPTRHHEHNDFGEYGEDTTDFDWAIKVKYIYSGENNERISEIVEYPTSKERIDQLLKNAGIDGVSQRLFFIESMEVVIPGLEDMLPDVVSINELNFLASKIMEMDIDKRETYAGIIAVKKPLEDITKIINFAFSENITRFGIEPAFGAEMYGDFLVNSLYLDDYADVFYRLKESNDPHDRAYAAHIQRLEANVDKEAYGRAVAKEENGIFTNYGYVTGGEGVQELYRSEMDIPAEYILYEKYPTELRSFSKAVLAEADSSELAYLADKIAGMDDEQRWILEAVAEAGWHCGNITEIINVTENLDCFTIQPASNESEYGEYRLMRDWDESKEAVSRLEKSDNAADRALAKHITLLNRCADEENYGHHAVKNSEGVFTEHGFLVMDKVPKEIYRGVQDLPAEYRLTETNKQHLMVENTDLAALLMEMHAVGGEYMRDAQYNLKSLSAKGDDFFIRMHPAMLIVTPADLVFRRDTDEHQSWMTSDKIPDMKAFVMSVTSRAEGRVTGNLCEIDFYSLQDSIRENSFFFTHFDAEMKDGTSRRITLDEWDAMDRADRSQLKSWVKYYDPADELRLSTYFSVLRLMIKENKHPAAAGEFLTWLNEAYMQRADNPKPDMLRIAPDAAKEILAQSAADVYRLMPGGAEKLPPIEAVRIPLYQSNREFAVKLHDLAGIEKWAQRASGDILRQAERGEQNKAKNNREEL